MVGVCPLPAPDSDCVSSPLLASAVVERTQLALTAAATMVEVEEAVATATAHATPVAPQPPASVVVDYERLADVLVAALARAEAQKLADAAELEELLSQGRTLEDDTAGTEGT